MIAAESTELFVGPRTALLQVVRLTAPAGPVFARVSGPRLHSPRHGEALRLGPFGYEVGVGVSSWELVSPFCVGGVVAGPGRLPLDFTFAAPVWASPGNWSAVVRVAAGDLVRTTAPIRLEVAG